MYNGACSDIPILANWSLFCLLFSYGILFVSQLRPSFLNRSFLKSSQKTFVLIFNLLSGIV